MSASQRGWRILLSKEAEGSCKREEHIFCQMEIYRARSGDLNASIRKYQSQILEGPTYVCSCCGCLHFRRSVVILKSKDTGSWNHCNQEFLDQVT